MVVATELQAGMVIRLEGEVFRVLEAAAHAGTGKLSGFVHARLTRVSTGTQTERRFRLDEKLEDLPLDKRTLQFLYQSGDDFYIMDPESFDQLPLPRHLIGEAHRFLKEGMRLPATQTSAMKRAGLENGMEILVPLFIKEGELVRVEVASGKYLERVREGKR